MISAELSQMTEKLLYQKDRDQERYDRMLEKQSEILDQRLGLGQVERASQSGEAPRAIPRRMDFGKVRAEFEKKQRHEYWTKVIDDVEDKDKKIVKAKE